MKLFCHIAIILLIALPCYGAVLFETNFDDGSDWTHTQPTGAAQTCLSSCGMPDGLAAYLDGMSYCGGAGNNNFYIDTGSGAGSSGHGGTSCYSGEKCATFWMEGCQPSLFEDSDGNLGVWLDQDYFELYIGFRIRFQQTFSMTDDKQMKIMHIQHNTVGSGTPWSYNDSDQRNRPYMILDFYRYGTNAYFAIHPRCVESRTCDGTPGYNPEFNSDFDGYVLGTPTNVFNSNNWHHVELHIVVNSGSIDNWTANGSYALYYDGVLKGTWSSVVMNDNGSGLARRGYNFISIGGNNNLGVTPEQWYSIDDLVISTTRIGTDYVVGSGTADTTTMHGGSCIGGKVQ